MTEAKLVKTVDLLIRTFGFERCEKVVDGKKSLHTCIILGTLPTIDGYTPRIRLFASNESLYRHHYVEKYKMYIDQSIIVSFKSLHVLDCGLPAKEQLKQILNIKPDSIQYYEMLKATQQQLQGENINDITGILEI